MRSVLDSLEGASVPHSRAGIRQALQIPAIRALANNKVPLTLAAESLGADAIPFRATLFDKSAASNWLVVWHQDTALPLRKRVETPGWGPWSIKESIICAHAPSTALERIVAVRIHLDGSNENNGSLRVLPGTHRSGVLSDNAIEELTTRIRPIECHVTAGGVLLMRPLLVHASSKAKSENARRRILHIEYASRTLFPGGIELKIC